MFIIKISFRKDPISSAKSGKHFNYFVIDSAGGAFLFPKLFPLFYSFFRKGEHHPVHCASPAIPVPLSAQVPFPNHASPARAAAISLAV